MSVKRMSEDDILFHSIKKDTEYAEPLLKLATIENDDRRLRNILLGIQIRDKKELLKELRAFIEEDVGLSDEAKQEYSNIINENEDIYLEIERVIADKLHIAINEIENEEGEYVGYDGIRDTISNFHNSSEEIMLRSNLMRIINAQRILQEEFQSIEVTEENAEEVLKSMNNVIDISVNWLDYLKKQSNKHRFDLYQEEFWQLMDETIIESKGTLRITEDKRQGIATRFPEIAKKVDDDEEKAKAKEDDEGR